MLKHGLIGLWCAGVCLAAVYAGSQYGSSSGPAEPQFPILTEHHSVSSDLVTVPIVRDQRIDGYMIAKVTLTANDEAYHGRAYPVGIDVTEQLISMLQGEMPVLTDPKFTIDLLQKELVGQMNARLGREVFYNTLVTQLDYLTPADLERMRDPLRTRMKAVSLVDPALLDTAP